MKKILLSVMSVGAAGLLMGAATFAVFSSQALNTGNVFSTGILNLLTAPAIGLFDLSNMKPGDSFNRSLNVTNNGTLNLTYNGTSTVVSGPPSLVDNLMISVEQGGTPIITPEPISSFNLPNRNLASNTTETLNFTVSLSSNASNDAQNQTANATFNFTASQ